MPKRYSILRILLTILILAGIPAAISAQENNRPPLNLNRKLSEFRVVRPEWVAALGHLLNKTGIPHLIELDTLTYRDMSARYELGLFTGPEHEREERGQEWFTAFKVDLKDVTVEQALKEILKDQPRYDYELIENDRCLHIFPRGIQGRKDWPLNQTVPDFSIDQEQISQSWYRKVFGTFLFKYRVHICEFSGEEFSQRLIPRTFKNDTLRELLMQLSASCRMGWIVEPFPAEEIKFRDEFDKEYYERGYDIGRPGSNGWCQIHYSFLKGTNDVTDMKE